MYIFIGMTTGMTSLSILYMYTYIYTYLEDTYSIDFTVIHFDKAWSLFSWSGVGKQVHWECKQSQLRHLSGLEVLHSQIAGNGSCLSYSNYSRKMTNGDECFLSELGDTPSVLTTSYQKAQMYDE